MTDDWKRELCDIAFARMPIIVWTTVLVTAVALAFVLVYPPTFEATGSLILRSKTVHSSAGALESPDMTVTEPSEEDLASEQELLTSSALIERTIAVLQRDGLVERPADVLGTVRRGPVAALKARLKKPISRGPGAGVNVDPEVVKTAEGIRRNALKAVAVPDSTIVKMYLAGPDAERIEQFLDTLMSEYLQFRMQIMHPSDQREFFRERRDFYSERLQEHEAHLKAATDATSVEELDSEITHTIELERTYQTELGGMRNLYMEFEQRSRMLEEALKEENMTYFAFLDNIVLERLGEQLMTLTVERGRLTRQFLEDSPQIEGLDANIDEVTAKLRTEVLAIHKDAVEKQHTMMSQIKMREFALAELEDRILLLQDEAIRFRQLSRETELLRSSFESFARRSEQADVNEAIAASAGSGDVTILTRPIFTAEKVFPKRVTTLFFGILFGIAAGVTIAFVAEFFDHRIRRASDVALFTSIPVIGSIRRVPGIKQRRGKAL